MQKKKSEKLPGIVVAGFFALDIVFGIDDPAPRFYAGGTSGNVSAGLAFLGWNVVGIGRLAHDVGGEFVRRDLARWGVNTEHLGLEPVAATPIVLEKISLSKNGVPKHRFLWNCPDCSSYFPPYKAVLGTQVEQVQKAVDQTDVFFADRVSRSTVALAAQCRKNGGVVFFEPSAAGDPKLFREMLGLCDVLKYSAQRARSFSELLRDHNAFLEIETLGEDGLRFRTGRASTSWNSVPAFEVKIKDTAGCGDWTTVGLISRLLSGGKRALEKSKKREITSALEAAQAIAALNCQFEGPRGAMYHLTRARFQEAVDSLKEKRPGDPENMKAFTLSQHLSTSSVCPACGPVKLEDENKALSVRTNG